MKTYVFMGYLLNGSGSVSYLKDWTFESHDYFFLNRPLQDLDSARFLLLKGGAGMHSIEVSALNLQDALSVLPLLMSINRLDLVLSDRYTCISGNKKSRRFFRVSK